MEFLNVLITGGCDEYSKAELNASSGKAEGVLVAPMGELPTVELAVEE